MSVCVRVDLLFTVFTLWTNPPSCFCKAPVKRKIWINELLEKKERRTKDLMLSACSGEIRIHCHKKGRLTINGRRRQGAAIIISPRPPDYSLSIGCLPAPTGMCLWTEMKTGPVQSTRPAWRPVFYYCQHVCLFSHSKYAYSKIWLEKMLLWLPTTEITYNYKDRRQKKEL